MATTTGSKNSKYGRNTTKCGVYRMMGIRERNKKRKMRKHLNKYTDEQAYARYLELYGEYVA